MSRVIDDVYVTGSGADDSFRSGSASFGHPHVSGCWPFMSCRALYTEPVWGSVGQGRTLRRVRLLFVNIDQ